MAKREKGPLGTISLAALVVGSIIGAGVFDLAGDMAKGANLVAILIGWAVVGIGMTFLALSFVNLARKEENVNGSVYDYAKEGFGKFVGFNSAWGYALSALLGNVSYAILVFASLGYFFPIFSEGNLASIIGGSVLIWLVALLLARGVKQSSLVESLITLAKLIPIGIFIVAIALAFKFNVFSSEIWGAALQDGSINIGNLVDQVKSTMLVAVFVFIGIEGAAVMSGRAKNHKVVARATVMGLLTVLAIYALLTVLSLGVMTAPELAALESPSMAQVLQHVVGDWGAILINIGLIVSVLGAWLAWTMFAMELPYRAAKEDHVFPKIFAKENKRGAPIGSLIIGTMFVQVVLLSMLSSSSAFELGYSLCTSMILVPYALVAAYQLKVSLTREKGKARVWQSIVGIIGLIYALWLIYATGMNFLLVSAVLYAIGVPLYLLATRGQKHRVWEAILAAVLVLLGAYALYWMIFAGGYAAIMG